MEEAFEAQNEAVESRGRLKWRRGGSKLRPEVYEGQWSQIRITMMRSRIRVRIKVKSWIRIRIGIKVMRTRIPNFKKISLQKN